MAHGGELRRGRGADLVRDRLGLGELGMVGLEAPQLDDEGVVLGVGDLRRVQPVVAVGVVADELPELRCPYHGIGPEARGVLGRQPLDERGRVVGAGRHRAIPEPTTTSPT